MMLFSLVPFWAVSPDAKVIGLSGVEKQKEGAEKEKGKKKNPGKLIWFAVKPFQGSVLIKAI